jgi:outer membrane protein TolC
VNRQRIALGLILMCSACASVEERETVRRLHQVEQHLAPLHEAEAEAEAEAGATEDTSASAVEEVELDGRLEAYIAYAYAHSPELRATFEEWRASTYGAKSARRLPETQISYAAFVRHVETRVGPQQHRLGVMQWFPWPTKIESKSRASALEAESRRKRFEAHALDVNAQVSRLYWKLWLLEREQEVLLERKQVLLGLSEQVRTRVEVGKSNLAGVAQINLALSRVDDRVASLEERRIEAGAALASTIGAPDGTATPISDSVPKPTAPRESREDLRREARSHPRVEAIAYREEAGREQARAARAQNAPSLGVGADWIITGDAADPTMPDSGKDAVLIKASLKIPLWYGAYKADEKRAEAQSAAHRAHKIAAANRASAEVERHLAHIRDAQRRDELYVSTLLPQAQAAFESVRIGYQSGTEGVAELLMVERDLLDLELDRLRAQAKWAASWAELERVVGRPMQGARND